jgi:hypothetical protein
MNWPLDWTGTAAGAINMPTWVKCTTLQDEPILVNLDNVTTLHWNAKATPNYTTIAFCGGITASVKVKEAPEKIAGVRQSQSKDRQ